MNYPFNVVVIHHEGAGAPSNNYGFGVGGYSYGIGVGGWRNFREPVQDYSTADYNHVTMGVCLSGNREDYVVTSDDMNQLRAVAANARTRGWLVGDPTVRPHREMGGSNKTICPGQNAAPPWQQYPGNQQAWNQIVACFQASTPKVEEEMLAFPSRTQPGTSRFRGLLVDVAGQKLILANAAECNPSPAVVNTRPIVSAYEVGAGRVTVITGDVTTPNLMEYVLDLP